MARDVRVELEVDVEVDSDELEIEVGDSDTAEASLDRDGLEIEVEAEIEKLPRDDEYEEPEFDDAATDETVGGLESNVESIETESED